jgi:hypothetical protein
MRLRYKQYLQGHGPYKNITLQINTHLWSVNESKAGAKVNRMFVMYEG